MFCLKSLSSGNNSEALNESILMQKSSIFFQNHDQIPRSPNDIAYLSLYEALTVKVVLEQVAWRQFPLAEALSYVRVLR